MDIGHIFFLHIIEVTVSQYKSLLHANHFVSLATSSSWYLMLVIWLLIVNV
jgi:hypothetical protein